MSNDSFVITFACWQDDLDGCVTWLTDIYPVEFVRPARRLVYYVAQCTMRCDIVLYINVERVVIVDLYIIMHAVTVTTSCTRWA